MFSGRGFKNFEKKCKNKKKFENDHQKSHENENRPKNEAKMGSSSVHVYSENITNKFVLVMGNQIEG